MTEVVSVRFKSRGKLYYFSPNGIQIPDNTQVVVETSKGLELGECAYGNFWVEDERIIPPIRPVIRIATDDDLRIAKLNKEREKEAFAICQEKIEKHGLDMKLVDVECNFEGSKILFFFASEGRVDFRELVKDLASVFRTRIELRQIGVRDEAKMLGGLGICGRPFCCSQFLDDFQPVSTKMAKTQSMSLNPTKISGTCGRLMCCLRYEQDAYEELVKSVPKSGAFVETPDGYGNVIQVNMLRQKVKVRLDGEGDQVVSTYDADEVAAIPGGRPKPGEPVPSVLKLKPNAEKKPEEPDEDPWAAPILFAEEPVSSDTAPAAAAADKPSDVPSKSSRRRGRGRGGHSHSPKPDSAAPASSSESSASGSSSANSSRSSEAGGRSAESSGQHKDSQHRRHRSHSRPKPQSQSAHQNGDGSKAPAPSGNASGSSAEKSGHSSGSKRHHHYNRSNKPKDPGGQKPPSAQ